MRSYLLLLALSSVFIFSCKPETYTPKPLGYYHIELPQHAYKVFDDPRYPYTFEYPAYANIVADTSYFGQRPENPYWINIVLPSFDATINITYKIISPQQTLDKLLEDAHRMSYYHTKKADYIEDKTFKNPNGVSGLIYDVEGNAASSYQFLATDSTRHYLRGALYFNVTPNADSLKPVNEFLRKDIAHLLYTLKWK